MIEELATKYRSKVDITEAFLNQEDVQRRILASGLDVKVLMVGDAQRPLLEGGWGASELTERTARLFMFEKALNLPDDAYFGYLASSVAYALAITDMTRMINPAVVPKFLQEVKVPEVRMALGDSVAIDYFGIDVVPSRVEMYRKDVKGNEVPFNFLKYLAKLEKTNPEHARRIRVQTIQSSGDNNLR